MQLTGRAGRRGIDEKGESYILFDRSVNAEWYQDIFNIKSNRSCAVSACHTNIPVSNR